MGGPPQPLFCEGDLPATLDQQRRNLAEWIRGLDADQVLLTPVDDLVEESIERFRANPIVLLREQMTSTGAKDVSLTFREFGRTERIEGSRVEWHVPFEGDVALLKLRPSSYNLNPPRLEVRGAVLIAAHEGRAPLDAAAARAALDKQVSEVENYLGWQRADIDPFNASLPAEARAAVERRRQKVLNDRALDAALEVPVQRQSERTPSIINAPKRRRPRPTVAREAAAPFAPEPAISDATFSEIVGVIESGTTLMERQPGTFRGMVEESLRDLILVALNTQFGAPTAETFSGRGKTDIFLPLDEAAGAVFIAECKVWKGPAGIAKALDQLLGYMTWRDTKAALIVFQKSGARDDVLQKAIAAVRGHTAYKRDRHPEKVFTLGSAADPTREVHVALVLVPLLG